MGERDRRNPASRLVPQGVDKRTITPFRNTFLIRGTLNAHGATASPKLLLALLTGCKGDNPFTETDVAFLPRRGGELGD